MLNKHIVLNKHIMLIKLLSYMYLIARGKDTYYGV